MVSRTEVLDVALRLHDRLSQSCNRGSSASVMLHLFPESLDTGYTALKQEDHGRQFIDSVCQFEGEYRVLATLSDNDDVSQVGNPTESNGCEPFTGICTNRGGYDSSRHSKRQGNHLNDQDSMFEAEDDLNDSWQCTQRRHRRH